MKTKDELIRAEAEEYRKWQDLLRQVDASVGENSLKPSSLSLKDVLVHLKTWQEISLARLEAALQGGEPAIPDWTVGLDHNSEDDLDAINARIFEIGRNTTFAAAYEHWTESFQRFMTLTQAIPEGDWFTPAKYAWLSGFPLSGVVDGSLEHHREHREQLAGVFRKTDPG